MVTAEENTPLPNAEVIDRVSGARTFTSTNGIATLRFPASGALSLRIRQLGHAFVDRAVRRADLTRAADTVVVQLRRIPFALPVLTTTADRDCPTVDPSERSMAFWALDQLRESAERYEQFRTAYPFTYSVERRSVTREVPGADPKVFTRRERGFSEDWGERYKRGEILSRTRSGFSAQILFVVALADPAFWEHHCVAGARLEGAADRRQVRLYFAPNPKVRTADWEGEALLDSSTSTLQRVDFKLRQIDEYGPRRLEGFTTFRSPSPYIVFPTAPWRCGGVRLPRPAPSGDCRMSFNSCGSRTSSTGNANRHRPGNCHLCDILAGTFYPIATPDREPLPNRRGPDVPFASPRRCSVIALGIK